MTAGSAAQVLLAWEPPEAVMPLLPRCKFTGRTLAEVRRRGWAQSVAEREPGWRASPRRSATAPGG
jgi:DNA-binding IclR family transcriptional regulator